MDYQKHYNMLIDRARNRIIYEYTETHHIVPRCVGGTDELANIVELTPEEQKKKISETKRLNRLNKKQEVR